MGLGSDSHRYANSIFQQSPSYQSTQYAEIDRKIIRLLYDHRIKPGMTQIEVDQALRISPPPTQVALATGNHFEGG